MATNSKYALITGATNGIGYELAKLFAQDHYNLIIVARHPDELSNRAAEFQQQYGVEVVTIAKDLSKREGYEALKAGKLEIISGLKNKAMVAASKLMPGNIVAENMHQQSKPSEH